MTGRTHHPRSLAIVLGCGDVGSAAALALHRAGLSVVLVDGADPAWHRRGMAFTNAWYVGNAELDGEGACFCASLKSIPSVLARRLISATTWSWPGVAAALAPIVLVDARGRKRRGSEILRDRVPLTIGIGVDFVAGENVDVGIELPTDSTGGPRVETNPLETASHPDFGANRGADCIVEAARHGRFMTERRIGDVVRVGQIVGGLGNEAIAAPAPGVLLGLPARGARIEPGDILVEVDPTGVTTRCHGVGEQLRHVAARVTSALADRGYLSGVPTVQTDPVVAGAVSPPIVGPASAGCGKLAGCEPPEGGPTKGAVVGPASAGCGKLAGCEPPEGGPTKGAVVGAASAGCGKLAGCEPPEGGPTLVSAA